MDTEKILKELLAKQGIEQFYPIVNSDNRYGYVKDNHFVICDENLNPLPYENKNIIVRTDPYGCEYEICDECYSNQKCFVVNKSGSIISHIHNGAKLLKDGTIVTGHSYNTLCRSESSILNIRKVNVPLRESDDGPTGCIIDDNGICDDYCFVAETPRYYIFVKVSDDNKGVNWKKRVENRCFVKEKNGTMVAEKTCSYIWVHRDNSLDLISSTDGRRLDIHKVDFDGKLYGYEREIRDLFENEDYRLTIANEYESYDEGVWCQNEFITDKYLVMESVRLNGIYAIDYEVFVLHYLDKRTSEPTLTKSVCRAKKGEYGGEYINGISNNILKIEEYAYDQNDYKSSYHIYYDIFDMERINHDDDNREFFVCQKRCGSVTLYGVMNKHDCSLVVPICFSEVKILGDVFIVSINRQFGEQMKKDIGVFYKNTLIVPIGLWDSYNIIHSDKKYGEYIAEYTSNNKKGVIYCNQQYQQSYCIEDAIYSRIEYDKTKGGDVIGAFVYVDESEDIDNSDPFVGYLLFKGFPIKKIKPVYDSLRIVALNIGEGFGGVLFIANEYSIIFLDADNGDTEIVMESEYVITDVIKKNGLYAFCLSDYEELNYQGEPYMSYRFFNIDLWPFHAEELEYEDEIYYIRLSNGAVFIPNENRFICKIKDYEPLFPPEELDTLEEILEWEENTPDVDNTDKNENDNHDYDEPSSYSKYGGYNGLDDDTIDNAFEGDPDATWNID